LAEYLNCSFTPNESFSEAVPSLKNTVVDTFISKN
jgi:hypothetical protein